jgi:hypothetical protein
VLAGTHLRSPSSPSGSRGVTQENWMLPKRVVLLAAFCLWSTSGLAAESTSPYSTSSIPALPVQMAPHRSSSIGFTDLSLYASVIAYRAMDYLSTEPCVHSLSCEEKELPHFVVDTKPGFIVFEGSAAAAEITSSYLLHRRGHAKLAREFDVLSIGAGTWAVQHNYRLSTGR